MKINLFIVLFLILGSRGSLAFASSKMGTYLKSVYSLPLTLDPIQMNDTSSLLAANLIFDGLLRFSPTLEIEGALAESWSTSSNGEVLTFKLRPNLKFHNGDLLTSHDVVFSLKRALSNESTVRKYYDCIEGADEKNGSIDSSRIGIKAIDPLTVEIHLKNAFPAFASVLAGATAKILPAKYVDKKDFFRNPIGSGAFQYIERDDNKKKLTLHAFADYYRGKPKLNQIVLSESIESESIILAKKGQIHDLANWPLSGSNDIFKIGKNISTPVAATWIIGLNTKVEPFKTAEVRESFKASFDSELFRKTFYPDSLPAYGYIPPGLTGYRSDVENVSQVEKRTSNRITIAIPDVLANHQELKKFIEQEFKSKGWFVEVRPMPWDELMKGYVSKTHQAFLVSMNMDYPDADFLLRNFETNNPDNFSGISDKVLDRLINQFRTEPDKLKRAELNNKAIKLLDKLSLTINLFHPRANYWTSSCVDGFQANILSDVYIDYSKVSLNEKCIQKMVLK